MHNQISVPRLITCTNLWGRYVWSKLIVPPALAQGAQVDLTCPWLVFVGDPGCPGIDRHFLARAELGKMADTSGKFDPWLMIFIQCARSRERDIPGFPDWKTIKLAPYVCMFIL